MQTADLLEELYVPGALDSDAESTHTNAEWRKTYVPGGLDSDADFADDEDDPNNDQYTPRRPSRKSPTESRRNTRSRFDQDHLWGGEQELVIYVFAVNGTPLM